MNTTLVALICISGFLDLFGVALIYPQLIHRAKQLGASPSEIGWFSSIYGALQFFCGPLMGQLSDHVGRRSVLLLALIGTSVSYFLLGTAESIMFLGLARVPSGMFKFSQAMNKAYIADAMPVSERVNVFGKFNSISSMGFIFGPSIAGWLVMTDGGFRVVAFLSGFIFVFNAFFNHYIISSYITPQMIERENKQLDMRKKDSKGFSLFASLNAFNDIHKVPWHLVWDVFLIRFLMSFSLIIYRANFTSILTFTFNTNPVTNGYIQSFNGVVSMATGWLVGYIQSMFSGTHIMHNTFGSLLAFALLGLTISPSLLVYVLGIVPLCIASSVLRVVNLTEITARSGTETRGLVLGLADTLTALARMFGPIIAGYAFEAHYMLPGFCAAFLAMLGTALGFYVGHTKKSKLHSE